MFNFSVIFLLNAGAGIQWDNIHKPVSVDDNFTFGQVFLMLIVDSIIHLLIMWYVEAVKPGTYGIPQPPYFFVLVSRCALSLYSTFIFTTTNFFSWRLEFDAQVF